MDLRFLGGVNEVGRSALLVDGRLLLDYGVKTGTPPQFPVGDPDPDAVVVSHGHLDHAGAVPALLSGQDRPDIHWTPATRDLALRLARDTLKLHGGTIRCPFTEEDVHRVTEASIVHDYGEPFEAVGYRIEFSDAGHIPGSAHVHVTETDATDSTRLLYASDFHPGDESDSGRGQRLVPPSRSRPPADVVVTESTYADTSHDDREALESRFVERVRTTLWDGGTVVVPVFAIGRTQELMLVCAAHDIPCYVDGMGTEVTDILLDHPRYLRDPAALRAARGHARFVTGRQGQRERIAEESAAILTTSGMLQGGPAHTYIPEIRSDPTNLIAFTGYQVAGTPGRRLLDTGRAEFDGRVMPVAARVESFDFSAHGDREGLLSFLSDYDESRVLVTHGDRCQWFADELKRAGFDATAPTLGEEISVT
jgi:putative mRNA 3-end processing factor